MNSLPVRLVVVLVLIVIALSVHAAAGLNLVPWPKQVKPGEGIMPLTSQNRIVYDHPLLGPLAVVVQEELKDITGFALVTAKEPPKAGDIFLKSSEEPSLKGGTYRLVVGEYATIEGGSYSSVAAGTVTLLQAIIKNKEGLGIPRMAVLDGPDTPHRGLMIDVARQRHSIGMLKEAVQLCRLYKVNYLHLHLSDNQSFTFPSKAFPKLATPGHSYTREELVDLVAYADARGVTIVPEIDVPAHAIEMCKRMPELFKSPVNGIINFADPAVWNALGTLFKEISEVFRSSPYIHIGADEANLSGLTSDPQYRAAIKKYNVGDIHGLFNYFVNQMNIRIKQLGKRTIMWEGFGLRKQGPARVSADVIVMFFDNYKKAQDFVNAGHDVINTSWCPLYVVGNSKCTPEQIYVWQKYKFGNYTDPYPRRYSSTYWRDVTPTPKVLGSQVCAWEQREEIEIPSLRSRLPVMAERVWNPGAGKAYGDFALRFAWTDMLLTWLIMDNTPPGKPQDIAASYGLYREGVLVTWRSGANFPVKYDLYRGTNKDGTGALKIAGALDRTEYLDRNVQGGKVYYYWCKAWNRYGWSESSAIAIGATGKGILTARAHEGFVYRASSAIDGLKGGNGWKDAWKVERTSGKITVKSEGLRYGNLIVTGGSLNFKAEKDKPGFFIVRNTEHEMGADVSTTWFSYLIRGNKIGSGHCFVSPNSSDATTGKVWENGFGFQKNRTHRMEEGKTYFVVCRFDHRVGNDNCYIWINPRLDKELLRKDADAFMDYADVGRGTKITINIQGYGRGDYDIDELRFGRNWREVAPVAR